MKLTSGFVVAALLAAGSTSVNAMWIKKSVSFADIDDKSAKTFQIYAAPPEADLRLETPKYKRCRLVGAAASTSKAKPSFMGPGIFDDGPNVNVDMGAPSPRVEARSPHVRELRFDSTGYSLFRRDDFTDREEARKPFFGNQPEDVVFPVLFDRDVASPSLAVLDSAVPEHYTDPDAEVLQGRAIFKRLNEGEESARDININSSIEDILASAHTLEERRAARQLLVALGYLKGPSTGYDSARVILESAKAGEDLDAARALNRRDMFDIRSRAALDSARAEEDEVGRRALYRRLPGRKVWSMPGDTSSARERRSPESLNDLFAEGKAVEFKRSSPDAQDLDWLADGNQHWQENWEFQMLDKNTVGVNCLSCQNVDLAHAYNHGLDHYLQCDDA